MFLRRVVDRLLPTLVRAISIVGDICRRSITERDSRFSVEILQISRIIRPNAFEKMEKMVIRLQRVDLIRVRGRWDGEKVNFVAEKSFQNEKFLEFTAFQNV